MGLKNIINEALANYPGKERIQELQNIDYQNNPTDMSIGPASNFRHSAAMNELSKSLSPMNNKVGNFVGDSLAYGLGAINEVPDMFRGVNLGELASGIATMNPNTFKGAFNPETLAAAREDLDANYMGTYGTPNSSTIEDVFARTLGYQAPTNTNMKTASTRPGYGAVQASELTNLERDFPGMSTGDIIDSMNNRQAVNRYSGQMGPVKSDMAAPRALDMERFAGISKLGRNDEDVEQVEYLGSPSKFQNFKSRIDDGLGSFRNKASQGWDFAQQLPGMAMGAMTGIPGIGALMGALGNAFEDRTLGTSNVVDEYGNVHSSADLNKQNARGGGYTEAARSSRRARARLNNVLARKAAGKKYGNLDELLEISRKQQELDNLGYAGTPGGNTGSGAFAKFDNTSKNYGPHTKGGGNQGGGFSGAGAGTGSRGPRSRDGGIIMDKNFYANGGLATLFARRG